jgi:hypothetical protein
MICSTSDLQTMPLGVFVVTGQIHKDGQTPLYLPESWIRYNNEQGSSALYPNPTHSQIHLQTFS